MSADRAEATPETLKQTPLHALHIAHGARMVAFAGYDMPVQYALGVLKEHLHTRAAAGLFDVSHMGQIVVRAKSGNMDDAARALERLVPNDILGLKPGRQRYAFLTNDTGGVRDDLMAANLGDYLLLVVNAASKVADMAHLEHHLSAECTVEVLDQAMLALQGPKAEAVLAALAPACVELNFMDVREMQILGAPCVVARSGYTGEDGFEISLPASRAEEIAEALLENSDTLPIGLGARDSLRIEAGLPLYGADIDSGTTPIEAGLSWAIGKARREGGRAGGFPGASIILDQINTGTARRRVGLRPEGRAPVRAGALLFADQDSEVQIGQVTSGVFGPSVEAPVAMAIVPSAMSRPGTTFVAEVRTKRLPVAVVDLPFVAHRYKRNAHPSG